MVLEDGIDLRWANASEAVYFRTSGNYGSTFFDPIGGHVYLDIVVCDKCLRKHKDRIRFVERTPVCPAYTEKVVERGVGECGVAAHGRKERRSKVLKEWARTWKVDYGDPPGMTATATTSNA
jgi:hypothetical protein